MSTKQFMLSTLTDLSDSAVQPSVALSGNRVVAVYRNGGMTGTALYYQAGTLLTDGTLSLGVRTGIPQRGNTGSTDDGETPTVAINSQGVVIEIHESDGPSSEIWTHVGAINGQQVVWGDSQDSGHSGNTPSVALTYIGSTHLALATFESSGTIYVMVSQVNATSKTAGWTKLSHHFSGNTPRIAVNNQGNVVLVYVNGNNIYSIVGQLNSDHSDISWASSAHEVDSNADGYPAVGLSDDGFVTLAYQGATFYPSSGISTSIYNSYTIRTQAGSLDSSNKSIAWAVGFGSGLGKKPSIATNGTQVIILQESYDTTVISQGSSSTTNPSNINFATSDVRSIHQGRDHWMSKYADKTLKQLCLPAAHDAGMSTTGYCTNLASVHANADTKTQSKDFKALLDCGIRYFDVRPVWFKKLDGTCETYTGHFAPDMGGIGCLGRTMTEVFDGIINYLNENYHNEVIILKFSHYYEQIEVNNGTDDTIQDDGNHNSIFDPLKKDLIESLVQTFNLPDGGSWLYRKPRNESRRLVDIPLSSINNGQSKIIAVFDDVDIDRLDVTDDAKALTYSYADYYHDNGSVPSSANYDMIVFDRYSNTDRLSVMVDDGSPSDAQHPGQLYQYLQNSNHHADLYLLSWTLTQQLGDQITGSPSIADLAGQANLCLGQYLQQLIQQGHISNNFLPNILYVDFCDNFVTDAAVYINNYLHGE